MSSTKYVYGNLIQELKNKNSLSFKFFDSEKILFEKDEALKDLELDDNVIDNSNVKINNENKFDLENKNNDKKKSSIIQGKESIVKNSNIVIISDRNCLNLDSILEKNLHKLERQIKTNSDKKSFKKK
jgi:hypothetical protein